MISVYVRCIGQVKAADKELNDWRKDMENNLKANTGRLSGAAAEVGKIARKRDELLRRQQMVQRALKMREQADVEEETRELDVLALREAEERKHALYVSAWANFEREKVERDESQGVAEDATRRAILLQHLHVRSPA